MKTFPTFYLIVFWLSMLLFGFTLEAQVAIPIASNESVTTTIFFPSNIAKVIPPAVNFNFEHEENTRIGLLRGRKGKSSNLLVITEDGFAYSFALSYSEEVKKFNFILNTDQAVSQTTPTKTIKSVDMPDKKVENIEPTNEPKSGNVQRPVPIQSSTEGSIIQDSKDEDSNSMASVEIEHNAMANDTLIYEGKDISQVTSDDTVWNNDEDDLYNSDREEYYRIYCENNYLQKPAILRVFRQDKKVLLRLNNILVDRNEKYFVLQIENNSRREFYVEGVSFFKKTGVGKLQKIMTPLYTFNIQEKVDPDSINEMVLVFENFNISNKEEIIIVLADIDYEKMVKLPLKNIIVNYPSN